MLSTKLNNFIFVSFNPHSPSFLLTLQIQICILYTSAIKSLSIFKIFIFITVLPACMSGYHVLAVLPEARRGRWIPWNCNYTAVRAYAHVLGITLGSSGRVESSLEP